MSDGATNQACKWCACEYAQENETHTRWMWLTPQDWKIALGKQIGISPGDSRWLYGLKKKNLSQGRHVAHHLGSAWGCPHGNVWGSDSAPITREHVSQEAASLGSSLASDLWGDQERALSSGLSHGSGEYQLSRGLSVSPINTFNLFQQILMN